MENLTIQTEETDNKGSVFINDDSNNMIAEMTYSKAGESMIIIDHTDVGDSLRGYGVGRKLLDVVVEKARNENKKILPICPFAKSQFDKDETIRDVLR